MDSLFFEDLSVGYRFSTQSCLLTEAELIDFSRRFDPQPFHLDAAAARHSVFGGLVASGWHTAALTMRLMVTSGARIAGGMIGLSGELSWPKPTRAGDELHAEAEVVQLAPTRRPERGIATLRIETRNQRSETVQLFTVKMLVPRRAATGEGNT